MLLHLVLPGFAELYVTGCSFSCDLVLEICTLIEVEHCIGLACGDGAPETLGFVRVLACILDASSACTSVSVDHMLLSRVLHLAIFVALLLR
jgi:hypothetical protein